MAEERRTERGRPTNGTATFDESQRIWLLERDMDIQDDRFDQLLLEIHNMRKDTREEVADIRGLVASRLNLLVGIGFSLLIAIIAVLVTANVS